MILVTGAAGKTGLAVLEALGRRRAAVRALVRREEQAAAVRALGAREVMAGEMTEAAVWRRAAAGIEAVYHICPNMHPREEMIGRMALSAARSAGVSRFVYHSVLHPQTEKMPHHWQKLRVEEALFESRLSWTVLQPAAYMQNVLGGHAVILGEGEYRVPYLTGTRMSLVDLQDVAAAAAVVLTEPGHCAAIYELAGPEALNQAELASALTAACRRLVRAVEVSPENWRRQALSAGLDRYAVDNLLKMFDYYARFGFTGNSNVLRWLLTRPPATFAEFAAREFSR